MENADRVLKAIKKEKESITEIARFLSLHPSTVGKCIEQLKTQYPITERQEGHKKYFRLPRQSLPLSTGPGDPWGHLRTWGKTQSTGSEGEEHMSRTMDETPPCKTDPRAPHGFDRNASHNADRYVCECEGWEPPNKGEDQ